MECYRVMYDEMLAVKSDVAAMTGLANLMNLTRETLLLAPADELAEALDTINSWYLAVRIAPNAARCQMLGGSGHPVRMLYQRLLANHGALPSMIDRQDPEFLYLVLTEEHQEAVPVDKIPAGVRALYGL